MPYDLTPSITARFWAKVDRSGECWLWTAVKTADGYGQFRLGRNMEPAHRVAWEMERGPIPDGLYVLHNCPGGDNPACCNSDHLWLGTGLDNALDCIAKGRANRAHGDRNARSTHPETTARGERASRSKLTREQVLEIRAKYPAVSSPALAIEYGVSPVAIRKIIHRRAWAHV